jgi:hypothetical protein
MSRFKSHDKQDEPESLQQITHDLLQDASETAFEIAVATGLTHSWIAAFSCNRITNPSCNKVQRLYEYLTGSPLLSR